MGVDYFGTLTHKSLFVVFFFAMHTRRIKGACVYTMINIYVGCLAGADEHELNVSMSCEHIWTRVCDIHEGYDTHVGGPS